MKSYTIAPVPPLSLVGFGGAYLVAFGALWLFIEPLGTFGLIPTLSTSSAIATYVLLLLIPAVLLTVVLRWYRWHKVHNLPFIKLLVRSAADGATYSLRVAENMQVNELLRQYVQILRHGPARNQVEITMQWHYPVLQVWRNGKLIDVDGNLTVHASALRDGEECQVRAQKYEYVRQTMLSRTSMR